jgi:enoyl-CoA hydratase/carnithine racemase
LAAGLNWRWFATLLLRIAWRDFAFRNCGSGLIPGFGGIPRLKRDLGNAVVRDLLLTGRSFNVMKAQQIGLVSQIAAEGEALAGCPRHRQPGREV